VKPRFRTLAPSEVDGAFKGYLDVFEWLAAKGVRQWLRPLSREAFAERQAKGELFGYFVEEQLAAVVTIAFETSPYWLREAGSESRWWIKSLAVAPGFRHAGIGVRTLGECERHLLGCGARGAILDCVDAGFLPGYYSKIGFSEVARKDITYPSGNTFLMVLMAKNWPERAPDADPASARGGGGFHG
jgi:ribosomal protein S18 acetylase RimI-like enzyme